MKLHRLVLVAWIGALTGCNEPRLPEITTCPDRPERPLDDATFNAGLDPNNKEIVDFVGWLTGQGVTLQSLEGPGNYGMWKVSHPRTSDEYNVTFSIRSFPEWAAEEQMQNAIQEVNLAYQLNPQAHLAMSYAGFSGTHPEANIPKSDDELPKVGDLPVTKAVEQLFKQYKVP